MSLYSQGRSRLVIARSEATRQSQGSAVRLKCPENRCQEIATAPSGPRNDKQKTDVIARRPQADVAIRTLCRQSSSVQKYPSLRGPTSFACPKEVGKKTTHRGRAFYKPPSPCVPPPPASEACPASLLGKVLRDRCPCRRPASGGAAQFAGASGRPHRAAPTGKKFNPSRSDTSIFHFSFFIFHFSFFILHSSRSRPFHQLVLQALQRLLRHAGGEQIGPDAAVFRLKKVEELHHGRVGRLEDVVGKLGFAGPDGQ